MVKYRIPEQFRPGFLVISDLSHEQVKAFCNAVEEATTAYSSDSLVRLIKDNAPVPYDVLRVLVSTVFSLNALMVDEQTQVEDFAVDMADSYADIDNDFVEEKKDAFRKNLIEILENSNRIKLIMKAQSLIGDYDKVFEEARILSDVRFVLTEDLNSEKQSAIVVHQLKIEFVQNGEVQKFFIALDVSDLKKLRTSIDRAIEKESRIKSGHYFGNLEFIELSN